MRAELTAFLCLLKNVIVPIKVHVNNKGTGERKCIDPKSGDADLWIQKREELHRLVARDIVQEVEHVKARRTNEDVFLLKGVDSF